MPDPLAVKSIYSAIATLTGTKQSIMALLIAQYSAPNIPPNVSACELHLQADPANSTNNCLIGDVQLTTSIYSRALTSTAGSNQMRVGPYAVSKIPLTDIYAIASGGSPKLLITAFIL